MKIFLIILISVLLLITSYILVNIKLVRSWEHKFLNKDCVIIWKAGDISVGKIERYDAPFMKHVFRYQIVRDNNAIPFIVRHVASIEVIKYAKTN